MRSGVAIFLLLLECGLLLTLIRTTYHARLLLHGFSSGTANIGFTLTVGLVLATAIILGWLISILDCVTFSPTPVASTAYPPIPNSENNPGLTQIREICAIRPERGGSDLRDLLASIGDSLDSDRPLPPHPSQRRSQMAPVRAGAEAGASVRSRPASLSGNGAAISPRFLTPPSSSRTVADPTIAELLTVLETLADD
ncbi:MAG: hypothetical protein ACRENX_05880 [Candidatus Dormibacteria bacterium]